MFTILGISGSAWCRAIVSCSWSHDLHRGYGWATSASLSQAAGSFRLAPLISAIGFDLPAERGADPAGRAVTAVADRHGASSSARRRFAVSMSYIQSSSHRDVVLMIGSR